jgi:hypothetical protein
VTPSEMGGYHLRVNPRYDFAEVEQYLRQLGEVG